LSISDAIDIIAFRHIAQPPAAAHRPPDYAAIRPRSAFIFRRGHTLPSISAIFSLMPLLCHRQLPPLFFHTDYERRHSVCALPRHMLPPDATPHAIIFTALFMLLSRPYAVASRPSSSDFAAERA